MKVLLGHNFYQSSAPSGEDAVFKAEKELLQSHGIEVIPYTRENDEIMHFSGLQKVHLPFQLLWSRETYKEVKNLLKKHKPDLAHFHNIFYLLSPSVYDACQDAGVPVIQTLHNFRFFCINGLLMRNGRVCEACIGKIPWRGILHGCYKDSRLYSLPLAFMASYHRIVSTWQKKVNAYIALTEHSKKKYIECGLPEERIFVKPNFLPNHPQPSFHSNNYSVYLGRISQEKGVETLISAFKSFQILNSVVLKIVGDGPLRIQLENKTHNKQIHNIEFLGRKNFSECMKLLQDARFLVVPSLCYECFPLAIREAFAVGKPVIASRLGSMAELVEDGKTGLLFEPGNAENLAEKITWMVEHENACVEMGKNARRVFEEKYTAEKNFEILVNIYQSILNKSKP